MLNYIYSNVFYNGILESVGNCYDICINDCYAYTWNKINLIII